MELRHEKCLSQKRKSPPILPLCTAPSQVNQNVYSIRQVLQIPLSRTHNHVKIQATTVHVVFLCPLTTHVLRLLDARAEERRR